MLFNSFEFLIFFPIVVLMYFTIKPKWKNAWLLVMSYCFYMGWNPVYAFLLLGCTIITYVGSRVLQWINDKEDMDENKAQKLKKICVAMVVILNISILFYFKYFNFALSSVYSVLNWFGFEIIERQFDIVLPVGISFFTFQAVGYTIDVYRKDIYAEKNFLRYALFVSFFPQLVAGPIERSKNLLKQLDRTYEFEYERVRKGLLVMLWGFFLKMVIADRCAIIVNVIFNDYLLFIGLHFWIATFLFAMQIYCDFMGYSIIAKGAAMILGYQLMDNFERPYFARTIKEFWRRWHISLSSWLRDYVYIPLGGSRCSKLKKYRNLMITFLISGIWHGANWTYIVWGVLHGVYQIVEELLAPVLAFVLKKIRVREENIVYKMLQCAVTFFLVAVSWVFFRAESLSAAIEILKRSRYIFYRGAAYNYELPVFGVTITDVIILVISILILLVYSIMEENKINVIDGLSNRVALVRYPIYWIVVVFIVFSLNLSGGEFIYFQF